MLKSIHKELILNLLILTALAFFLSACGRKAPPVAPRPAPPPMVNDLSYKVQADMLKLNWSIPKYKGKIHPDLEGFWIYRSQKPLSESACPHCTLKFKLAADIGLKKIKASDKNKKGRMAYSETLAQGYRYIYKVVGYDDRGSRFSDSNLVSFKY